MDPASAGSEETYCNPPAGERLIGNFLLSPAAGLLAGIALAASIALIARWHRALTSSGAVAAVVVATACVAGGWDWAAILIAFFLSSTALSQMGEETKRSRTSSIVEKGGERDAWQVLANGSVFAVAAAGSIIWPSVAWQLAGAGAIAAATSDTWATEIGTLFGREPRSIVSWQRVETGTSGGVTLPGILAAAAGSTFIALISFLAGWPPKTACAALAGGFGGSLIDSVLGASVQARRWCARCDRGTERAVHVCGTVTSFSGGIRWLDNDFVNLVCSLSGALIGLMCLL